MKRLIILTVFTLLCFTIMTGCTSEVNDKKLKIEVNGEKVEGVFSGTLVDGVPNGEGVFNSNSGWKYTGSFVDGTFTEGDAEDFPIEILYNDSNIKGLYEGKVSDLVPNGKGSFKDEEDDIMFEYTGNWEEGKLNGEGNLNTDCFIVHFTEHDRQGTYLGRVYDGHADGEGYFETVNDYGYKYTYEGEWKDDLWNGHGEWLFDNNEEFNDRVGTFVNSSFTPSPSELIASLSTWEKMSKFDIGEDTYNFVKNHESFFPIDNSDALDEYVNDNYTIDYLVENREKAYDELFYCSQARVSFVYQTYAPTGNKDYVVTYISAYPESGVKNPMLIYYNGELNNIFTGDKVSLYALPIGPAHTALGNKYIMYACNIERANHEKITE